MNPERWRRVEELFRAALERPSDSRMRFLDEACDDGDVRHEVESLLCRRDAPDSGTPVWPVSESLPNSTRLGPYEILGQIGAGGMGTVHRARDTRLDRIVAIKICREPVSGRFEREARAIAALNHPHICTLHDLGEHDGVNYLVMEYVEGESLAERLTKGPLPAAQATRYAIEIADALSAAHARGIVHRDLKPGNIMVTKTGVKVLDFGLAKIQRGAAAAAGAEVVTHPEVIAGTPQYMSPEQIQGKDVDSRSDIFSFGLVLFEMLSGRRAFDGENAAVVTAAILEHEVPALQAEGLNRVVRACLEKDPNERLQTARDLRRALEWNAGGSGTIAAAPPRPRTWIPWAAAAGFAALALLVWLPSRPEITPTRVALTLVPPASTPLSPMMNQASSPEISPDGLSVMYRAGAGVWVWRLDSLEPQPVHGSEGITNAPFWSPDSKTIAFDTTDGLFRARVPDGAAELITRLAAATRGGSWSDKGTVLISIQNTLYTVPASGGDAKPVDLTALGTGGYKNPQFLSGGEDFLILRVPENTREGEVYLATLHDGKVLNPKLLMKNDTAANYTPMGGGRILFVRNDGLYAQKVNRQARTLEGEAELVQMGVASVPGVSVNRACFSVSRTGVVAWRPGRAALNQVTIFDRKGRVVGTAGLPASVQSLTLSPDEKRLLAYGDTAGLLEPGKSGFLALEKKWNWSAWSPDGSRLLGSSRGMGLGELAINSAGPVRGLGAVPSDLDSLQDVSPDGKYALLRLGYRAVSRRLDQQQDDPVVTQTDKPVIGPGFSPDGRWIVYSQQRATYVQPFPGPGLRTQIATGGGFPVWRKDGREIVIFERIGLIQSVPVSRSDVGNRFGAPQLLFSGLQMPVGYNASTRPLAVSRDGSRLYFLVPVEQKYPAVIDVGVGWVK